ncbi:NRPS like protein [Lophiostoma macrostomum CBS 122681]|uniref:NRPS like protein n=1 Tax=Lophiostoma macrostomum CBS 122681 TaxID=1314788 RepID=A0A6A6T5M9_9PLEO|nr:NRPS like protein [Lophiostoma macrostomum CBS 122681]
MRKQLLEFAPGFSAYVGSAEETPFFYREIFQDHAYDIAQLADDAFIIDAGANIGMFTLYMKKKYPSSTVLAFEPAPESFQMLSENIKLHDLQDVELHECALGAENTTQNLTFYPIVPGNSTLVPEEKKMVGDVFRALSQDWAESADKMYSSSEEISVRVRTLSHFLSERKDLKRIDMLKVDVEGAELETLRGLEEVHWALVSNVVVEICDLFEGQLDALKSLLRSKGFSVRTETPPWSPIEAKMFMVIGHRKVVAT